MRFSRHGSPGTIPRNLNNNHINQANERCLSILLFFSSCYSRVWRLAVCSRVASPVGIGNTTLGDGREEGSAVCVAARPTGVTVLLGVVRYCCVHPPSVFAVGSYSSARLPLFWFSSFPPPPPISVLPAPFYFDQNGPLARGCPMAPLKYYPGHGPQPHPPPAPLPRIVFVSSAPPPPPPLHFPVTGWHGGGAGGARRLTYSLLSCEEGRRIRGCGFPAPSPENPRGTLSSRGPGFGPWQTQCHFFPCSCLSLPSAMVRKRAECVFPPSSLAPHSPPSPRLPPHKGRGWGDEEVGGVGCSLRG